MGLERERLRRSLILNRTGEGLPIRVCFRLPRWAVVLSQVKVDKLPCGLGLGNDSFNLRQEALDSFDRPVKSLRYITEASHVSLEIQVLLRLHFRPIKITHSLGNAG